ncbi:MAG: 4-hydroxy-tetrahydrodipicolinate reductase [Glaciecola sp.]|jgi:4-hydroxy-tetrahydrodipicolinate reductase|uniref:4-hydroxy-tetrahydrodipicolinate reductase n=1 Tax=Congregibacter sp. TaxID=2744308 RepID=UPI0039E2FAD4
MSVRIAIAGGNGRMGRTLIELIQSSDALSLAAITLAQNETAPAPAPVPAELYTHDIATALASADVLVDFTTPETTVMHAKACTSAGVSWVIGTTGLDASQQSCVAAAAQQIAICQSANFSTGVNLMLRLVELATRASDDDTDLEVIEAHHRHKVDAPSGTALAIGKAMAAGRDVSLDEQAVMSREGITGARPQGSIGFATIRGGDIVGDHTALFASEGERLEITHRAGTRLAFARGACRAASWLNGRSAGLYDMQDVLQLRD